MEEEEEEEEEETEEKAAEYVEGAAGTVGAAGAEAKEVKETEVGITGTAAHDLKGGATAVLSMPFSTPRTTRCRVCSCSIPRTADSCTL